MKILYVEPAIFLSSFAMSLTSPLTTQYLYKRIWEETSNYSFALDNNISECDKNKSSPIFAVQKTAFETGTLLLERRNSTDHEVVLALEFEVQQKVSLFSLQMEMSGLIPGLMSTFILLSSSDRHGRKFPMILSSVGALATSIWIYLLSYFAFPFQLLIASTFIGAFCGNYTTFYGACFAYIVDQCKESKQKTIRIAIIDFMLGLVTGLTGLSSGYFIRELGFVWSFLIIAIVLTVNLTYILFFLYDPMKESLPQNVTISCSEGFKDLFYRTYMLFKNASGKQQLLLCLLLFTMVTYFFLVIGISPVFILYELGAPLCWNEIFIGYGSALSSISFLSSFLGIWLFSYCMEDIHIAFIGIFTTTAGMAIAAFVRTTLMMFLVQAAFLFAIMPLSALRSMLSKVVRPTEQGTLFACIAFLETLGGVTATSAFNGIYSATVAWFPGFTFLLSAGLLFIPMISLWAVKCINWREESELLTQEEPSDDTSDR